jgi:plasmid maintenance system antidote protein VapI
MEEDVHIGELIKKKLKESGHSVTWLAKKIPCHRTNIYKIFAKKHIHHLLLARINKFLDYNFFSHYPEYKKDNEKV